jgi:hypothetical protein
VAIVEADATTWEPAGAATDLIVSRHGVMFFDEPERAYANLAGFSADGAGLMFSCYREMRENLNYTEVAALLPPADGPPSVPRAPGPFAFADRDYVRDLLNASGWLDVEFEAVDFAMIAGAGDDPVNDAVAYWSSIGPAALRLAEMDDVTRRGCELRLAQLAGRHSRDGVVALRAAAWIVTARKA